MSTGRALRTFVAAAATGALLAACGGGGSVAKPPSALDPAARAPASAVAYVSVAIRPQRSLGSDLTQAIDAVAGRGSARRLGAKLDRSLGRSYGQFKRWVGQHVGIAFTAWPANVADTTALENDIVVIAPTGDPAAARAYLTKHAHSAGETWKVVGDYAFVGGQSAVAEALATTGRASLAAAAGFRADMAQLGGDELVSMYLPLHRLIAGLAPLVRASNPRAAAELSRALRTVPAGATAVYGATAVHNGFRMDLVTHGMPRQASTPAAVPADVGALPGDSWLALTLSANLTRHGAISSLSRTLPQALAAIGAAGGSTAGVPGAPLRFLERDVLPALGPLALTVAGNSQRTIRAGVVMSPVNRSAGARLAAAIKQQVRGLPIAASDVGGHVVVTFGYNSLQELLSPSSRLADNPTFKRALAQLPSGARADLFLDFGPLAALASLAPSTSGGSTMRVLHRLDYLIAGGTAGHYRLVLMAR